MSFSHTRWLLLAALIAVCLPAAQALAQPLPDQNGWQPGPNAVEFDYACDGYIDGPFNGANVVIDQPFTVNGWIVDASAQGWAGFDTIHVYQGVAGKGGRLLAIGSIGDPRTDVATALDNPYWIDSGFHAQVPAGLLPLGPNTLSVYAHSPSYGWWYKQVTVNVVRPHWAEPLVVVQTPKPNDELKTSQECTITGYALDAGANLGVGIDRIEVYIKDERGSERGQLVGTTDVGDPSDVAANLYGAQFANSGWALQLKPTKYHAGGTTLYVYAHSAVTGVETMVTVDNLNIVEK